MVEEGADFAIGEVIARVEEGEAPDVAVKKEAESSEKSTAPAPKKEEKKVGGLRSQRQSFQPLCRPAIWRRAT